VTIERDYQVLMDLEAIIKVVVMFNESPKDDNIDLIKSKGYTTTSVHMWHYEGGG